MSSLLMQRFLIRGRENGSIMPAVQWKLLNIQQLMKQNSDKHADQLKALEDQLARQDFLRSCGQKIPNESMM